MFKIMLGMSSRSAADRTPFADGGLGDSRLRESRFPARLVSVFKLVNATRITQAGWNEMPGIRLASIERRDVMDRLAAV